MLLLLARHGETLWNVEKRIQGWGDSPLTEAGVRQARSLGRRLEGEPLAAVYSSDLPRAVETARIIVGSRDLPLIGTSDLREMGWGRWEGHTAAEIEATEADRWARFIAKGHETPGEEEDADWESTTEVPGGETVAVAAARVGAAIERIVGSHPGDDENVLVVGHGGSLRFFFTHALGMPARRIRRFHLANASLSSIRYLPGHPPIIMSINDTGHHEADHE